MIALRLPRSSGAAPTAFGEAHMTEKITPAALAMLQRLDRLWPNDAPPPVGRDIAQELASRHLVLDSTFGMQITDEGRKYLRGMHSSGFERG